MTEHNLFAEIERLQRANKRHPPTTPARRKAGVLAAATVKTPRPVERPIFPGTSRNPERRPVRPRVPGTLDRPLKPVPEEILKRFPHHRDFA